MGGGPACISGISVDAKRLASPPVSSDVGVPALSICAAAPGAAPRSGVAGKRHRWPHFHPLPLEGTIAPPQRPRRMFAARGPSSSATKSVLALLPVGDANVALSTVPQRTQALQAQASSPEQGRG